ncbi:MAG: vitamin K epoxide reductase family protein, partial [Opitutaceae bacterium]
MLAAILAMGAVYSHVLTNIHRSIAAGGKASRFCGDGSWTDCTRTLGSAYSVVMGLPVTVYGSAWFAFLLALLVGGLVRKQSRRSLCRMLFWAILPGVGITLVYAGISALVLHTFCFYCAGLYLLVGLSAALAFAGMGRSGETKHWIEEAHRTSRPSAEHGRDALPLYTSSRGSNDARVASSDYSRGLQPMEHMGRYSRRV